MSKYQVAADIAAASDDELMPNQGNWARGKSPKVTLEDFFAAMQRLRDLPELQHNNELEMLEFNLLQSLRRDDVVTVDDALRSLLAYRELTERRLNPETLKENAEILPAEQFKKYERHLQLQIKAMDCIIGAFEERVSKTLVISA